MWTYILWTAYGWAVIGAILGYISVSAVNDVLNNEDETDEEKKVIEQLCDLCIALELKFGIHRHTCLVIMIYLVCIFCWPWMLLKHIFG